ncbi:MOZ/SAS family protein [Apiospora rasikravindrae]|uniref:Histone acetyltransferase n=1 Tax=Apiospora rasikravindrae TaxID=990691 RepID=A0ABR1TFP1_9PEZI
MTEAEEELQQSVLLSEEDPELEQDNAARAMDVDTGSDALGANTADITPLPIPNNASRQTPVNPDQVNGNSDGQSEAPVDEAEDETMGEADEDDQADGDPADPSEAEQESDSELVQDTLEEDVASEEDADGEDDDEAAEAAGDQANLSDMEADEEDEAEGVGAVKIKPGETDEESESDADASSVSSDSAAEWDEAAEIDEDDDEEESEAPDTNSCMFCKKDEEHDPSEEFEAYLTCKGCGEHSHQQCARDASALSDINSPTNWKCPECVGDDDESEMDAHSAADDAEATVEADDGAPSPASSRRLTDSKLARDLLPASRGTSKPDSHSVFNQLVLDEDPMDGSRILRKRKTSSAEVELEDGTMSLRKRTRDTSDVSTQDEAPQDEADGANEALRPRSSRSLRIKISNSAGPCTVSKKSRNQLELKMRVDARELQQIISKTPKPNKRFGRTAASRSARSTAAPARGSSSAETPLTMAPFMSSSYTQPFYSFYDKETDELKGKPYGGILTEAEADTSKTLPTKDDRRRFDEAKQKADEEWRNRLLAMQAELDVPVKKSKKATGPASQIECIEFGGWEIDTWYAAPYPEEYSRNRVLYICEFCLKYMNSDYVAWRHKLKCPAKHPPGDEIYRHGSVSFFEVDGRKNPVYCQNLCLLAKLFLGSKTLYYDVEPFLFYVLCEYDDLGYHFVGYFSKEKRASSQNNVSCILTLPIHQRKGYGNLLIDFSYLLTRVEEKTGSPEKPLSDMGLVSYRNYWRLVMCKYLLENTPSEKLQKKGLSIRKVADDTGMMPDDVISALEGLRCLVRDPQTKMYAFRVDLKFCEDYVEKWESKNYVKLRDDALTWTPYVMGRSNATNFELGPALNAIAPREEEEESKPVQLLAQSGIATGDFALVNGNLPKPSVETEATVLESTEPNDNSVMMPGVEQAASSTDKENVNVEIEKQDGLSTSGSAGASAEAKDDWSGPYSDIPITRFEVFPPVNLKRPGMPRITSSITRPAVVRTPATVPRPRVRRSVGTGVRKSAAKPKPSTARRKTGGTGRGPGRWPKGTKKSDYGNADSGPGLPPAWIEREKQRQASLTAPPKSASGENAEDTVQVQVKESKGKRGSKNADSVNGTARSETKEAPPLESNGILADSAEQNVDVEMGDEDAEGEDE